MSSTRTETDFDREFNTLVEGFAKKLHHHVQQHLTDAINEAVRRLGVAGAGASVPTHDAALPKPAKRVPAATKTAPPAPSRRATPSKSTPKVIVECPAPGCKNFGVRSLSNFCVEHNKSLKKSEKLKLRKAQRQARESSLETKPKKPVKAVKVIVVACPAPGCKNPGKRNLMNFCVEHNKSLRKSEKRKLRKAQKRAQESSGASTTTPKAQTAAKLKKPSPKRGKVAAPPVSPPAKPDGGARGTAGTGGTDAEAQCPIVGCGKPGDPSLSNFCPEHAKSYTKEEREKFYELQVAKKAKEKASRPQAPAAPKKSKKASAKKASAKKASAKKASAKKAKKTQKPKTPAPTKPEGEGASAPPVPPPAKPDGGEQAATGEGVAAEVAKPAVPDAA